MSSCTSSDGAKRRQHESSMFVVQLLAMNTKAWSFRPVVQCKDLIAMLQRSFDNQKGS